MCGITGGWTDEPIADAPFGASMNALLHRGPDDGGTLRDGSVVLGMRRLSIIDVGGGHQPVFNEDGSVAVVFNGEIYNYRELIPQLQSRGHTFRSQSDTETLVHLYEEYGPRMCEHLRGMFAFAIWDKSKRRLFLARDRFGKKPLYYTRTSGGGILFASELKALRPLMAAAGVAARIDEQGIYDFLSLGMVPQPRTIFQNVHSLPPGSWLSSDGERADMQPYWQLDYTRKVRMPYGEVLERTRELISDSVKVRLRSDVPLGVFLSGGIDSSVIAYEAAKQLGQDLDSFTVSTSDPAFDEAPVAARTARELGIRNHVLPLQVAPLDEIQRLVRQYDQPYADYSALPTSAISRLARQHVTVVLTGDGGDEVFGGYRRYVAAQWASAFRFVPSSLTTMMAGLLQRQSGGRRSTAGFGSRFLRGLGQSPGARYLSWTTDLLQDADKQQIWTGGPMRPTEDWIEELLPRRLSGFDTQATGDIQVNLLSDLLVKMDIATMAHSLEARSPLLDHQLAEFLATLPDSQRITGGRLKGLLRDAYRGRLPDEVILGKKRGFEFSLSSWLENELRGLIMDTLGSPAARVRSFLNGQFIDNLLAGGILRDRNCACLVYALLVLELWLVDFAEGTLVNDGWTAPAKCHVPKAA
ncbi:MAG: asparagine synthase (glutamine-hydrolyzing) [Planctomycetota bacterium]